MLVLEGAGKAYDTGWGVQGVGLQLEPGTIHGLIGNNGAGKSTTIRMIVGLTAPTEGTVTYRGRAPTDPEARRPIGYVPEDSPLYEEMTPLSYLRYFARLYGVRLPKSELGARLTQMRLEEVHWTKRIGELSKGSARKVALARALLGDPELLVLDEPRSGLDPASQAALDQILLDLARQGKAILLSAHDLDQVETLCDALTILHQGRVVAQGPLHTLLAPLASPWHVRLVGGPEATFSNWADAQAYLARQPESRIEDVSKQQPRLRDLMEHLTRQPRA